QATADRERGAARPAPRGECAGQAVRDEIEARLDNARERGETLDGRVEAGRFGKRKLARADEAERDPVGRPVERRAEQRAAEHEDRQQAVAPEDPPEAG